MTEHESLAAVIWDELAAANDGRVDLVEVETTMLGRLGATDVEQLKREFVKRRVASEDERRTKERAPSQMTLFADEDEFIKTGERLRVRKAIARYPDIMAALSIKQENFSLVAAAVARETAVVAKLSPYLIQGKTWNEAAAAYDHASQAEAAN